MFTFPYETTPCAQYVLDDVRKQLQRAMIDGHLQPMTLDNGKVVPHVYQVPPAASDVPGFSQPIQVTAVGGKSFIACDPRAFVRQGLDGVMKVTSHAEYQVLRVRTLLTYSWSKGHAEELIGLSDLPLQAYSRWVSEAIVRRLGLSPAEQMQLTMLAAYFYLCQHVSGEPLSEREKTAWAARIARVTRVAADVVFRMLDEVPMMANVIDFTAACSSFVQSARLERFNAGLLYSMLGGSWFGANAKEIVAVAIEYPPTFLSLLYGSVVDRSFRNTGFTRLVEQMNRNNAHRLFQVALVSHMESLADD